MYDLGQKIPTDTMFGKTQKCGMRNPDDGMLEAQTLRDYLLHANNAARTEIRRNHEMWELTVQCICPHDIFSSLVTGKTYSDKHQLDCNS